MANTIKGHARPTPPWNRPCLRLIKNCGARRRQVRKVWTKTKVTCNRSYSIGLSAKHYTQVQNNVSFTCTDYCYCILQLNYKKSTKFAYIRLLISVSKLKALMTHLFFLQIVVHWLVWYQDLYILILIVKLYQRVEREPSADGRYLNWKTQKSGRRDKRCKDETYQSWRRRRRRWISACWDRSVNSSSSGSTPRTCQTGAETCRATGPHTSTIWTVYSCLIHLEQDLFCLPTEGWPGCVLCWPGPYGGMTHVASLEFFVRRIKSAVKLTLAFSVQICISKCSKSLAVGDTAGEIMRRFRVPLVCHRKGKKE